MGGLCNYIQSQSSWHLENEHGSSILGPTELGCATGGFLGIHSFMDFVRKEEITVLLERFSTPYGLHRKNLVFQG